jgi:hypothetical protein
MNAWRACVRLWAFGSAAWLGFWIWNGTQCTRAVTGILLCPTADGEALRPITYMNLGLMVLGPPLGTMVAGGLLYWWTQKTSGNDSQMTDGS